MIRSGKSNGWLVTSPSSLRALGPSSGVDFGACGITDIAGKGAALVATGSLCASKDPDLEQTLLVVPGDLVLTKENIHVFAKSDKHLREVLEAAGDWVTTTRHAILLFLLVQISHSCPDMTERIGLSSPLTQYVRSLPLEDLPACWNEDELSLLRGTTLKPASEAKAVSLYCEFNALRLATLSIPWCQREWWDEVDGLLKFDDWRQVDAMYRSRALEFPGIGDCMIPCLDIANHASGEKTVARYETGSEGNALLLLRAGKQINKDDEITITYGDDKGACEMIFSYGFIEDDMNSAHTLFLDLEISDDDPLKRAKKYVADSAPGVRISAAGQGVTWHSDYVWLAVVNEEDGLSFQVLQTVDGERELQVSWQQEVLEKVSDLQSKLQENAFWPLFVLRAVAIVQARVEKQLNEIEEMRAEQAANVVTSANVRPRPKEIAERLLSLEAKLLAECYVSLEDEKGRLASDEVVQGFLRRKGPVGSEYEEEDFS